jgi:KipI family sensor histidine kinase inhibitor
MFPRVIPLGEAAWQVELGRGIEVALNQRAQALADVLRREAWEGITDIVPTYAAVTVHFDLLRAEAAEVQAWIAAQLAQSPAWLNPAPPRLVTIPVRYGGDHGPDLNFVAQYHGLSPAEVIARHTAPDYRVYMMGFIPGFAYLGGLDEALVTPRLATPRLQVPAGAVGIAGAQTGLYPLASPGGWQIIGRTEARLFDPAAAPPTLLWPGNAVRFVAVK